MKKNIYKNIATGFCLLVAGSVHAQTISTFAGTGGGTAGGGDGGPATAATFYYPSSVARDATGNVYVVEGEYIRKINASGTISTIAGNGTSGFGGDGGPATAASFSIGDAVSDIVADNAGNIYFTDPGSNRIRKINSSGIISTIAGTGTAAFSGDGGAATAADLYRPYGLALDAAGNMFIADYGNSVIRKMNMSTGIITTVAGTPSTYGYSGDGSAATLALLSAPINVSVDAAGNLYIADYSNHAVRKVDAATGNISTIAGTGTSGATGDGGAATSALLNSPINVSVDPAGNVFISDYSNKAIRKISTSGIITTVAGTIGTSSFSGDGGAATAATFRGVTDIFLSTNGDMYIADASNSRIRLVTAAAIALSGTATSCVAGTNTLAAATSGGAWSSGNVTVATVSATGVVTAVSAGTAVISYGMGLGFGSTVYTVNPIPVPVVTATGTSLSVAGSFSTYQWLLGGSAIAGAVSATHSATSNGSYAVTVTDANGCIGTSAAQIVSGVGINDVSAYHTMSIYPNPANKGVFSVNVPSTANELISIAVTNLVGEKVYETTAHTNTAITITLNVAPGLYLVHATSATQKYTTKIMVK